MAYAYFDPESVLSGAEKAQGMTFRNSNRNWPNSMTYIQAIEGELSVEQILALAPRVAREPWTRKAVR